jgi:hypothetical protein
MATLNGFILLKATCISALQRQGIVAFPLEQWLHEGAKMLHCTLIAYLII